ncbi:hypothetical protein SAMN02745121_00078 [Nannocystis exedens]|uniref:Uncharacterized protein n=1 Tax=Nannocystis exedens TaxID=54 RepID=A0A1I1SJZ1_9BACT|nr:hypothetical protein [Nannocystis exedens]PCC75538.1 hypothetical protein NAEX_08649 [Nannocystis exedens]SFD46632.1 hypothetical protein SAMN02745121_00078 [Nannocystis exedens]
MTDRSLDALLAALADSEERARVAARRPDQHAAARARLLAAVSVLPDGDRAAMKSALARPEAFILDRLNPLLGPAVARRALDLTRTGARDLPLVWPDVEAIGASLFTQLRPLVGEDIAGLVRQQLALGVLLWEELCAT